MLARLRRDLLDARISASLPGQGQPGNIGDQDLTCDTIAA
jgi:hypothetical protein